MGSLRIAAAATLLATAVAAAPTALGGEENLTVELKDLNWIGFQQFKEVSRVFVRTTEPVKYTVDTSQPNMVVLVLENTRVPLKNNLNQLDTRYFDSPVGYIQARAVEGASQTVRVEITMRRKVPFKETQNDTFLALDFQRD